MSCSTVISRVDNIAELRDYIIVIRPGENSACEIISVLKSTCKCESEAECSRQLAHPSQMFTSAYIGLPLARFTQQSTLDIGFRKCCKCEGICKWYEWPANSRRQIYSEPIRQIDQEDLDLHPTWTILRWRLYIRHHFEYYIDLIIERVRNGRR